MNVGGDTYVRAIEDLQKAWPNDPASDMAAIDGALLKKQYGESLKAIDRLAARVGGDAYLHVMRAGVYVTWGKRAESRKELELAIAKEPGLLEPHWSLITYALEDKRFDDVAKLLAGVEKTGKVELADLNTVPQYAEFAASPAGKRWRTEHQVKPAPAATKR
jgi:predicted Zn-dependent protease